MILKKGNDAGSLISIRVNRQDIIEGKIERKKDISLYILKLYCTSKGTPYNKVIIIGSY